MRITDIRIDSFGSLRDRHFQLGPGLNVFYGHNESGKTTTMEFIRSILSPTRVRPYPVRSKTDSGRLGVEDEGRQIELSLGSSDNMPKCLTGLDPNLYRSIFAMNQKGLEDIDPVSSSEIRSKFLTIPGGDTMPQVIESIDEDIKNKIGLNSRSPSSINNLQAREQEALDRIAILRSNAESYSELNSQAEGLKDKLKMLKESNGQNESNNVLYAKVEAQRPVMENLNELRSKRERLSREPAAGLDDIAKHDELKSNMEQKRSACGSVESSLDGMISSLPGGDEARARSRYSQIEAILTRPRDPATSRQEHRVEKRKLPLVPMILLIAAIVCLIIPGFEILYKCIIACALIFLAAAIYMLNKNKVEIVINNVNTDNNGVEIINLMQSLGLQHTSVDSDTRRLSEIIRTLDSIEKLRNDVARLKIDEMQAERDYVAFVTRFRGEEGYQEAVRIEFTIKDLDSRIQTLSDSIRAAGFDPDEPLPVVHRMELDLTEQEVIGRELGSVTERMRAVLDTRELDSLVDSTYSMAWEMDRLLRESAVLILSSEVVQRACSDLYSDVHPDVITTTDRYLSMMTSGRYHIDTDPRNSEITVISEECRKGPKQWSTGLRAQIMLSLKLAIAKEMGNGEIPIILDDVLLPFDSVRKEGACRALSSVSDEMQILLFTCDDAVRDICGSIDGANVIQMV